jgi:hypothetical protein
MKPASIAVAIATAFTLACADGTLPARTATDPSNPNASEVPNPQEASDAAPGPALTTEGGVSTPPASHEHHHSPAPVAPNAGGVK